MDNIDILSVLKVYARLATNVQRDVGVSAETLLAAIAEIERVRADAAQVAAMSGFKDRKIIRPERE